VSSVALRTRGFGQWSVTGRLLVINALLTASLGIVSAIAWHALDAQTRAMNDLASISRAARYHQEAQTLQANVNAEVNAAIAVGSMPEERRTQAVELIAEEVKDFRRDLTTLERSDLPGDLVETGALVRGLAETFMTQAALVGQVSPHDPQSRSSALDKFSVSQQALDAAMERQTAAFARHIIKANEDASLAEAVAKRWLVTAWVLTTGIVVLLVTWLSRSIRQSLAAVRNVAHSLAQGDMTARNPPGSEDELGDLARAINSMADRLNDMISRLRAEADRDAFGTQLVEALEMADTEEEAYGVLSRAMQVVSPSMPTELLLADSSRAHLERAAEHPGAEAPRCTVESPFSCLAVRRGNPVTFADSEALNACSKLRGRPCGPVSAVCVPVSFMGRALGVLHAASPVGQAASARQIAQLTTLGIQAGARIGTLRAFNSTQRKATTDSLTGLPNRRAAEEFVRELAAAQRPFALAMMDLDHFKRLNDTRGHEAGDQALRLFAETLRQIMRDGDLAARWGGEEFLLLLPGATAAQAMDIVNRIRADLAEALLTGGSASFTVSAGIADTSMSPMFEQLLTFSDEALYAAKDAGRDRAVIGTTSELAKARHATEHHATPSLAMIAHP
jgi:diguanylate cyclase (GGDEF)-like protein